MKKALLIIAPEMFRDEEYFQTREALEAAKVEVTTASAVRGTCRGKLGATAVSDMLLADANPLAYDAVVFIGGGGAARYIEDPAALDIARRAYSAGKLTAAICVAPLILGAAGILKGKKATVFPDDNPGLKSYGADYTGREVEIDGSIITGSGPAASRKFGEAIAAALEPGTTRGQIK